MTKQRSQFGRGSLQTAEEVTESLILNSNHGRTSFAAQTRKSYRFRDICAVSVMHE